MNRRSCARWAPQRASGAASDRQRWARRGMARSLLLLDEHRILLLVLAFTLVLLLLALLLPLLFALRPATASAPRAQHPLSALRGTACSAEPPAARTHLDAAVAPAARGASAALRVVRVEAAVRGGKEGAEERADEDEGGDEQDEVEHDLRLHGQLLQRLRCPLQHRAPRRSKRGEKVCLRALALWRRLALQRALHQQR